jgi:hypothetical protein
LAQWNRLTLKLVFKMCFLWTSYMEINPWSMRIWIYSCQKMKD